MRRITLALALGAAVFVAAGCQDQQARTDIANMKATLNSHFQDEQAWDLKVKNAVCQLEADVYDVKDSGGDTRTAGPADNPGSNRLCPNGPGDPTASNPPPPPVL